MGTDKPFGSERGDFEGYNIRNIRRRENNPKHNDRAGREVPDDPTRDRPMREFIQNVGKVDFEAAMVEQGGKDDKYENFIRALHDPEWASIGFMRLAKQFGITLHEMQTIYADHQRSKALLALADGAPRVAADVVEDAMSKQVVCGRCDGNKKIQEKEMGDDGRIKSINTRQCPECFGEGFVWVVGDKHARDIVFESLKITGQKGPMVGIVQNFSGGAGLEDARMEGMLKMTQAIVVAPNKREGEGGA